MPALTVPAALSLWHNRTATQSVRGLPCTHEEWLFRGLHPGCHLIDIENGPSSVSFSPAPKKEREETNQETTRMNTINVLECCRRIIAALSLAGVILAPAPVCAAA